jgi:creatine kinase
MLQALGAQGFSFQFNDHFGFIHSCPTSCGTGMRASVHVKLPLLSKTAGFRELCDSLRVQARGEHSDDSSGVNDISNKERLGKTEVQLVQTMIDGVQTLIQKERELEATCVIGFVFVRVVCV